MVSIERGSAGTAAVGTGSTRLVIIRGNSGSGKSHLAQAIRAARPRGIAILGHDMLRREILHRREYPGELTADYLDLSARFALERGLHVVIEGILHSEIYGEMLSALRHDHRGITWCYRYDLDLEETLHRHRTKPLAREVTEDTFRSWYRPADPVPSLDEHTFGADVTEREALLTVLRDVGWDEQPEN